MDELREMPNVRIIPYDNRYRDDMIFMVLEAMDALGRVPRLNEDLLDIPRTYLAPGDMFWLALDQRDRVVGCMGYQSLPGTDEVKLHRFYVQASQKRRDIGTLLLQTAEAHLRGRGKTAIHVHLGDPAYFEPHHFYPKHGYLPGGPDWMKRTL